MAEIEKKPLLIELHYLPSVIYFGLLRKQSLVFLEAEEHFVKQTYRNRTYILAANNIDRLSVPIIHEDKNKPIKYLRIDYKQKWQQRHWRAIQSAYAKAPFFEYYAYLFESEIYKGHSLLWELNKNMLTLCLKLLDINIELRQTDDYLKEDNRDIQSFNDKRNKIHHQINYGTIHVEPYNQLFSSTFIKNLSILDLLFNEGTAAKKIVAESRILI